MSTDIKIPKKLIEVALPLDDINEASGREKSIRQGHPSTLHLWWARRPLAAARAVIFSQMVNDPGYQDGDGFKFGINKKDAEIKREKLFQIIRDLVKWENTNNEEVIGRAREAIWESWRETCHLNRKHHQASELFNPEKLPAFHDPFAGGGAIPLEAQRLGLESYASDLNPVAVLLNRAMIEIPPKFSGKSPIGPIGKHDKQKKLLTEWPGASGLAEDVRRYGAWVQKKAHTILDEHYPPICVTEDMIIGRDQLLGYVGNELPVLVWIWARTIDCPNPACRSEMPLLKSYQLSDKRGRECYLSPVVAEYNRKKVIRFEIVNGKAEKKGNVERRSANCECCGSSIKLSDIEVLGREGNIREKLVAIVAKGEREKVFLPANKHHEQIALSVEADNYPTCKIDHWRSCTNCVVYGLTSFEMLFTQRQLLSLSTLSNLIIEAREHVLNSTQDEAYANAIAIYLSCALSRLADLSSSMTSWISKLEAVRNTFARQAISMVWDFTECNPIYDKWPGSIGWVSKVLEVSIPAYGNGHVKQVDATGDDFNIRNLVVSTDPPYYDNIPYSNLSDYFYMWLRKTLRNILDEGFSTIAVPKMPELVANQWRHGGKRQAQEFFETGMINALRKIHSRSSPSFPVTIYYAFKQAELKEDGVSSSGWETFLEGVLQSGFMVTGTWPVRTERSARTMSIGMNALASSIVLVCEKRGKDAQSISRRQLQRELRENMPDALEAMIGGSVGVSPIAPVDLAQSAIGPGMAIFSKYESVLNQDGSKMNVHDALILINRAITDYLNPESGNFDNDTLFCDDWFSQYGWSMGAFGEADTLARAKGTSVDGVHASGVIESGRGKVRLLKWQEYPTDWDPKQDNRTPIWEAMHHLIRAINQQGESGAGELLARMPERGESVRQLAYHLYTLCERKGWAEDARAYNELITAWHAIVAASHDTGHIGSQSELEI